MECSTHSSDTGAHGKILLVTTHKTAGLRRYASYDRKQYVVNVSWFHKRARRSRQSPQRQYPPCTWNHSTKPVGLSTASKYVGVCVLQQRVFSGYQTEWRA